MSDNNKKAMALADEIRKINDALDGEDKDSCKYVSSMSVSVTYADGTKKKFPAMVVKEMPEAGDESANIIDRGNYNIGECYDYAVAALRMIKKQKERELVLMMTK